MVNLFICKLHDTQSPKEFHSFVNSLYFAGGITLDDCLSNGFIDMGGGDVAYRNPQNWLYITGNLKTREVIDIGLLNQPEYIRTDLRNVCGDFTYDSEFVSVDDIVEIFLESSVCHLFEIRK